ncbi:MAG: TetR/AcrR family transcriptional regulator [Hyphomicrobiales bacterium]|uniref:TetR/AcrR family transcriptional regulator n=1 Tax=Rhabdaerophilum calidifontis TaxID=2604328 RepID=UPI00123958FB|nr:TetR/AcrR family transcriptional regulator [Rhabdaerophilum calidifontis]MCA1951843.1 TetR/AcrR family transcriptional regulator [Hyphomicrobiales bacterium]MCA1999685.1 TetR/AcrR family transcriptional regulator [Hyphomicrobiales bacterium]
MAEDVAAKTANLPRIRPESGHEPASGIASPPRAGAASKTGHAPKTSKGERTRQRILDAAEREIGRRGFAETSISSITQEAEVAQGTFYVYFHSKEDVLRELVLRMGRRLRRALTQASAGLTGRLAIERAGIHAFFAFVRDNPNLYRVVAESQFVDEAAYRRYYNDFAASYRTGLAAAAATGEIAPGDAELRAWALMGVCDMVGRRYALWDTEASIEAAAEEAFRFVAQGLAPHGLVAPAGGRR